MSSTPEEREVALSLEPLDDQDVVVLEAIRTLYGSQDPVPATLVGKIQFSLTLDALQSEVAELTRLQPLTSGVRGTATESVRTVTFTSESLTTMVTITPHHDGTVRIDGWATPGAGVGVQVLLADDTVETTADEDGRFTLEGLPSGLAKFALQVPRDGEVSVVLSPTIEL